HSKTWRRPDRGLIQRSGSGIVTQGCHLRVKVPQMRHPRSVFVPICPSSAISSPVAGIALTVVAWIFSRVSVRIFRNREDAVAVTKRRSVWRLAGDHQTVAKGCDGAEKVIWRCRDGGLNDDLAGLVEHAQGQSPGVQIDPGVKCVTLVVKT